MPFDPRLIQPDDAPLKSDGEIDLPADLAALGEQLREDALHLAARYPASGGIHLAERPQPASAPRVRSWQRIAVLATTALATALVAVAAVQFAGSRRVNLPVANAPAPDVNESRSGESTATSKPLAAPPTISLTELSGPELEALLDLWQREPSRAERTGVSF